MVGGQQATVGMASASACQVPGAARPSGCGPVLSGVGLASATAGLAAAGGAANPGSIMGRQHATVGMGPASASQVPGPAALAVKPKRTTSAYGFFCAWSKSVGKKGAKGAFEELSTEEKDRFAALAADDLSRYYQDKTTYNFHHPPAPRPTKKAKGKP